MSRHQDRAVWHCHMTLRKYAANIEDYIQRFGPIEGPHHFYALAIADRLTQKHGNLLVYGGASALYHRLTGGTSVAAFDGTNAHIGVGDGAAGEAPTQTNLQGTNTFRKIVDASYPQHTDGTALLSNSKLLFRATFGGSEANFAWNEWGIFNASSGGRMLNRKVAPFGTKAAGSTWNLEIELSLS